jgi:hypothetical protein
MSHVRLALVCFAAAACSSSPSGEVGDAGRRDADASSVVTREASVDAALDHSVGAKKDGAPDAPSDSAGEASSRNPLLQPFATTSIWNMPIGSGASYVPANIVPATGTTLETDDDVIVLTPTAPSTEIFTNTADWNPDQSRCAAEGALLFSAPMPSSFVVPDPMAQTPNSGLAVLLADDRTIKQTQPFARCTASQPATSHYLFADVDLYGDGITGAHGGSGLSAIGGTLRLGELRPGQQPPDHVLKMELYALENYYNDGTEADCYRWPAVTCDSCFTSCYGGKGSALRPGSLLALPTSTTIASLDLATEPAKLLAWTLQNYGAYLVDDTAWSAVALCVENGAAGSFETQFQSDWGFPIDTGGTTGTFAGDMAKITAALSVVNNNSATSIGGGGTPLQPLAPPLPAPPGDP